ncbi:hypothetical protein BOP96_12230 [Pseudomonas sp. FSL W5-0203]|nr:hypothetical protein BOP96_12230 [Pseudomonas sp. FSL W5-0203]
MTITSKQKRTVLPLIVAIASIATYVHMLGSIWVLLVVPFMCVSLGILAANAIPAICAWFNRDGWK